MELLNPLGLILWLWLLCFCQEYICWPRKSNIYIYDLRQTRYWIINWFIFICSVLWTQNYKGLVINGVIAGWGGGPGECAHCRVQCIVPSCSNWCSCGSVAKLSPSCPKLCPFHVTMNYIKKLKNWQIGYLCSHYLDRELFQIKSIWDPWLDISGKYLFNSEYHNSQCGHEMCRVSVFDLAAVARMSICCHWGLVWSQKVGGAAGWVTYYRLGWL